MHTVRSYALIVCFETKFQLTQLIIDECPLTSVAFILPSFPSLVSPCFREFEKFDTIYCLNCISQL